MYSSAEAMKPAIEVRPRGTGAFDVFVAGECIGVVRYLWQGWYYSYLSQTLSLTPYNTSEAAVAALLSFHNARKSLGGGDRSAAPQWEAESEDCFIPP